MERASRFLGKAAAAVTIGVVCILSALLFGQSQAAQEPRPSPLSEAAGRRGPQAVPLNGAPAPVLWLPLVLRGYPSPYGFKGIAGPSYEDLFGRLPNYAWSFGDCSEPIGYARMYDYRDLFMTEPYLANLGALAECDYNNGVLGRVWLIGSKPDANWTICTWGAYSITVGGVPTYTCAVPRVAATHYHTIYQTIKNNDPNAQVFAGGILHTGQSSAPNCKNGRWWWGQFIDELGDDGWLDEVEGVHITMSPGATSTCPNHWPKPGYEDEWCMDRAIADTEAWYDDLHVGLGLGDRPIWITEAGCLTFAGDLNDYSLTHGEEATWELCRDEVMVPMTEWFDGQAAYTALYWYASHSTYSHSTYSPLKWTQFLVTGTQLTPLGTFWNEWDPN